MYHKANFLKKGFTLIELMVVFTISGIITTIMIASYPDFSSKIEFENLALDIALTIREAQVYGIGSTDVGSGDFDLAHGVYFDTMTPNSFLSFVDLDDDGVYDPGEEVKTTSITGNFKISDLCVNGTSFCWSLNSSANPLNVTFKRPNPDASILFTVFAISYTDASIVVENLKDGSTKTLKITNTGQLSVQ